jgi:catechol 2,3-dioxygenase-like lactoylglutathione lyase family enzyme
MRSMIDHISLAVVDYAKSRDFYNRALGPLGYSTLMEFTSEQIPDLPQSHVGGLGADGKPDFWIHPSKTPTLPTHLAFRAKTRAQVDEFHAAALAAGATCNGPPGIRAHYHPNYYGAFVIDPNGHNLEAVCHTPG